MLRRCIFGLVIGRTALLGIEYYYSALDATHDSLMVLTIKQHRTGPHTNLRPIFFSHKATLHFASLPVTARNEVGSLWMVSYVYCGYSPPHVVMVSPRIGGTTFKRPRAVAGTNVPLGPNFA